MRSAPSHWWNGKWPGEFRIYQWVFQCSVLQLNDMGSVSGIYVVLNCSGLNLGISQAQEMCTDKKQLNIYVNVLFH